MAGVRTTHAEHIKHVGWISDHLPFRGRPTSIGVGSPRHGVLNRPMSSIPYLNYHIMVSKENMISGFSYDLT